LIAVRFIKLLYAFPRISWERKNLWDSFTDSFASGIVDMGYAEVGNIALEEYKESNKLFDNGGIGKVVLHGVMGGVGAELLGGDFSSLPNCVWECIYKP